MRSYYSGESAKRIITSEIAAQLELEIYSVQCEENYHLDSKKLILDNTTLVILGSANNELFRKKVQENGSRSAPR
jgi:hypothetical protein